MLQKRHDNFHETLKRRSTVKMTPNSRRHYLGQLTFILVMMMPTLEVTGVGFLNNDSDDDIYVQSVAIDGKIAGNSVSLSLRSYPSFEPRSPAKGRRKRGEDDAISGVVKILPTKSSDPKLQKDEPEEGKNEGSFR